VGREYETKCVSSISRYIAVFIFHRIVYRRNYDYTSVHVTGAKSIAELAARNGVSKLVHVSHLNASLGSTSRFYQTKAEGELAVKEAFPDATIVRPATMYGYEDRLLNNMAGG
jgi:NADH dehydrogenase (ubiquinone) 1 alpha subcomplex subunit 9